MSGSGPSEQRLEFKIYPDGRVEEKVFGVKGEECLKVTEELNEKLGQVASTQQTEEMLEEKVVDKDKDKVYEGKFSEW